MNNSDFKRKNMLTFKIKNIQQKYLTNEKKLC